VRWTSPNVMALSFYSITSTPAQCSPGAHSIMYRTSLHVPLYIPVGAGPSTWLHTWVGQAVCTAGRPGASGGSRHVFVKRCLKSVELHRPCFPSLLTSWHSTNPTLTTRVAGWASSRRASGAPSSSSSSHLGLGSGLELALVLRVTGRLSSSHLGFGEDSKFDAIM